MQSLQGLKSSIDSAENLQSIVGTMKAHASSNINQFQNAAEASRVYRKVLDKSLYVVLADDEISPLVEVSGGETLHIVFGSDHGLAGRFNERIYEYALKNIPDDEKNKVIVIGQQIFQRLQGDLDIRSSFMQPQTTDSISSMVSRILVEISEIREEKDVEEIILYYNRPIDNVSFEEETEVLFPIDLLAIAKGKVDWDSKRLPTYFAEKEKLVSDLMRQYFFITLYRAFCFSLASENASRLSSMKSAEDNIEERLEELNFSYRRERQNSITEELNDVVAGFKAIQSSKDEEEEE